VIENDNGTELILLQELHDVHREAKQTTFDVAWSPDGELLALASQMIVSIRRVQASKRAFSIGIPTDRSRSTLMLNLSSTLL
jgi:hypothetical protein